MTINNNPDYSEGFVPTGSGLPAETPVYGTTDTEVNSGFGSDSGSGGKADAAKEQAREVASSAAGAGAHVASTAKGEAAKVASEAKSQAKDLYHQTRSQLTDQAGTQQKRVAAGLRSMSDELGGMAGSSEQSGVATDLVGQAASRLGDVASWLDQRDPGSLLDEVKQFAARRPGVFIGVAAAAGLLAGRLTRGIVSTVSDEKEAAAHADVSTTSSTSGRGAHVDTTAAPLTNAYGSNVPAYDVNSGSSATSTGLGSDYR